MGVCVTSEKAQDREFVGRQKISAWLSAFDEWGIKGENVFWQSLSIYTFKKLLCSAQPKHFGTSRLAFENVQFESFH